MWFESRFLQVHFFFFALVSSSSLYLSLFTGSVLDSVLPGSHEKGIPSEFFCFVKEQVMEVIDLFLPPFQEILFTCLLITALDPIFQSDVASQPSKSPTLSSLEQVPTFLFSAALKGPCELIVFSPLHPEASCCRPVCGCSVSWMGFLPPVGFLCSYATLGKSLPILEPLVLHL